MTSPLLEKTSEGLFTVFVYYSNLLLGWQLASFAYLYHTTELLEISNRLTNWYEFQPFFLGIGVFVTIILLIIHKISPLQLFQQLQRVPKLLIFQNIFLILLFINYLMFLLDIHLQVFELISFLFAIWILRRWGSVFYHSKVQSWRHPTTYGTFFISGFLIGFSLLSLLRQIGIEAINLHLILGILLIFELLIVFARFQFLSKSGESTRRIARILMGSKILYFGSRIIIGIFMPGIFILYMIYVNGRDIQGIEVLILVGTVLDKYLFINCR